MRACIYLFVLELVQLGAGKDEIQFCTVSVSAGLVTNFFF